MPTDFATALRQFRGRLSPGEYLILVGINQLLAEGATTLMDLTALQSAATQLEADDATLTAAVGQATTVMQSAGAAIKTLLDELAAAQASGNQAAVDAVTTQLAQVGTHLEAGASNLTDAAATLTADEPTAPVTPPAQP